MPRFLWFKIIPSVSVCLCYVKDIYGLQRMDRGYSPINMLLIAVYGSGGWLICNLTYIIAHINQFNVITDAALRMGGTQALVSACVNVFVCGQRPSHRLNYHNSGISARCHLQLDTRKRIINLYCQMEMKRFAWRRLNSTWYKSAGWEYQVKATRQVPYLSIF